MVALTLTHGNAFGACVTIDGLGLTFGHGMSRFDPHPGHPNCPGPGKRPLSAMTPTIVLKNGKLFLVLGSPGGPTIISTVANILMGVVDFGLDIQEAVNAPRFHNQWLPDALLLEDRISPDTRHLLEAKGHKLVVRHLWGDGECIAVDPKTGERLGASDGRNNGKAVGY